MQNPLDFTRSRRATVVICLLSGYILLAVGGCQGTGGDGSAADSTAAGDSLTAEADTSGAEKKPKKEKSIKVNIGTMRSGNLVLPVYADGAIRTPKSVVIKTKAGGEILDVAVRDGDRVRKGQLLAKIDPREYEIASKRSRISPTPGRIWKNCETTARSPVRNTRIACSNWRWAPCRREPSVKLYSSSAPAWPKPAWPRNEPS